MGASGLSFVSFHGIGSSGFGDDIWIQVGVSRVPFTEEPTRQHTVGGNQGPGTVASCLGPGFQGGNHPEHWEPGRLQQPDFPGGQVRQVMAPRDQPHILKWVDCTSPLQDGVHQDSEGAPDAERLAGEAGPQGCLLINPASCVPPEIPEVPLAKQGMAVPGPPLWTEQCPLHFHQGHEASGSHNEVTGNQTDALPRRHADYGPGQGQSRTAVGNSSGTPDFIGVHRQSQEECHNADSGNTIPGVLTKFPGNDDYSTSEQTIHLLTRTVREMKPLSETS